MVSRRFLAVLSSVTLASVAANAVDPFAKTVPSAVIEVLRLQPHEGFACFHA